MNKKSSAITLIEVITVIAIIAIIFAILFSVIVKSKKQGHKAHCILNLRSIGQALELYTIDNNNQFPDNIYVNYWVIEKYSDKDIFHCPLDKYPYVNRASITRDTLPTSYYPIPTVADSFYPALKNADDNHTTFVCLLHGQKQRLNYQYPLDDMTGQVLRLRKDTSVYSAQVNTKCWTNSEGVILVGRDWWSVFTDEEAPINVLSDILGISSPQEIPCSSN